MSEMTNTTNICPQCAISGIPPTYPLWRQNFAIALMVVHVAIVFIGAATVFCWRNHKQMRQRNLWYLASVLFGSLMAVHNMAREILGESNYPCLCHAVFTSMVSTFFVLPVLARSIHLAAVHCQQRRLRTLLANIAEDLDRASFDSSMRLPVYTPAHGTSHVSLGILAAHTADPTDNPLRTQTKRSARLWSILTYMTLDVMKLQHSSRMITYNCILLFAMLIVTVYRTMTTYDMTLTGCYFTVADQTSVYFYTAFFMTTEVLIILYIRHKPDAYKLREETAALALATVTVGFVVAYLRGVHKFLAMTNPSYFWVAFSWVIITVTIILPACRAYISWRKGVIQVLPALAWKPPPAGNRPRKDARASSRVTRCTRLQQVAEGTEPHELLEIVDSADQEKVKQNLAQYLGIIGSKHGELRSSWSLQDRLWGYYLYSMLQDEDLAGADDPVLITAGKLEQLIYLALRADDLTDAQSLRLVTLAFCCTDVGRQELRSLLERQLRLEMLAFLLHAEFCCCLDALALQLTAMQRIADHSLSENSTVAPVPTAASLENSRMVVLSLLRRCAQNAAQLRRHFLSEHAEYELNIAHSTLVEARGNVSVLIQQCESAAIASSPETTASEWIPAHKGILNACVREVFHGLYHSCVLRYYQTAAFKDLRAYLGRYFCPAAAEIISAHS